MSSIQRIAVLDTETTGMGDLDLPIEIAIVVLEREGDGWRMAGAGTALVRRAATVEMTPGARAAHHIYDHDLARACEDERDALDELMGRLDLGSLMDGDCLFAAHNAAFDRRMLRAAVPMSMPPWLCTYRLARHLLPDAPGYSNQVLRYSLIPSGLLPEMPERTLFVGGYGPQGCWDAWGTHRALGDAVVTANVLLTMLREHAGGRSLEELVALHAQPILLKTMPWGKHRGQPCTDVPGDYWSWLMRNSKDLDVDVLHTARQYAGRFGEKMAAEMRRQEQERRS